MNKKCRVKRKKPVLKNAQRNMPNKPIEQKQQFRHFRRKQVG